MIRVVSAATPNGGKGISGATDGEIYECLSASFPAFYLVVSGKKRNFAAKLYVELNEWRMKQVEERYISLLTNFGFDRLFEEAEIAKFTPQEMREYETSKMAYRDIKNSVDTAKREGKQEGLAEGIEIGREKGMKEGMEKGMAKGMEKGMAKGMEKGMEKGRAEGKHEANTETAQRLLAMGLSAEQVSQATQLPLEIIKNLSNT